MVVAHWETEVSDLPQTRHTGIGDNHDDNMPLTRARTRAKNAKKSAPKNAKQSSRKNRKAKPVNIDLI